MESPRKKRRVASQESVPNANSTPQERSRDFILDPPSVSGIEFSSSSSDLARRLQAQSVMDHTRNKENVPIRLSLLELLERSYSTSSNSVLEEADDDDLDYDEFFRKVKRISLKGHVWDSFKPSGEDLGSLYRQIVTDPRGAPELAKWCVNYCFSKPEGVGTYILYRFYFDCAGYQEFNLKELFSFPPQVDDILKKLNNQVFSKNLIKTKKILFIDNSKLGKILKYAIFNFTQKFVLEAHTRKLLYRSTFTAFMKLLFCMSSRGDYTPLVVTGFIFVIKLLTAICMVKEGTEHAKYPAEHIVLLDNYINILYVAFTKIMYVPAPHLEVLKITCLNELKLWIQYSPQIFLDHYNCIEFIKKMLMDQGTAVRLGALDISMAILKNEALVPYLKTNSFKILVDEIWNRVCDVYDVVRLKAIEVFNALTYNYLHTLQSRDLIEKIITAISCKDLRIGSGAGKCTVEILNKEVDDEMAMLVSLCKLANKHFPQWKPILVSSCIDHTPALQNFALMIDIFLNKKDINTDLKIVLSELLMESVHITLNGKGSLRRSFNIGTIYPLSTVFELLAFETCHLEGLSNLNHNVEPNHIRIPVLVFDNLCNIVKHRIERSTSAANHGIIANAIYPYLLRIVGLYGKNETIMANFFKILIKIAPEYLTKPHCEVIDEIMKKFIQFLSYWNGKEIVSAFLDFLLYVSKHLPLVSVTSRNAVQDLKTYVSEELYKSFKSRDHHTLIMAKKTAAVFKRFDLNEHIEWSKLLTSWSLIETNVEFVESSLLSGHHSLLWKINDISTKIMSSQYDKATLNKEKSLLSKMQGQYLRACHDVLRMENNALKFKAFERICHISIQLTRELSIIGKRERSLATFIPRLDEELRNDLFKTFDLSLSTNPPENAFRCCEHFILLYQMTICKVLPKSYLGELFKYFHKYSDTLGKIIEKILQLINKHSINVIPLLISDSIIALYEEARKNQDTFDIKSDEMKMVFGLSKKFHDCSSIMDVDTSSKILIFTIKYACRKKAYEILTFFTHFAEDQYNSPLGRNEIRDILENVIPESDRNSPYVEYFATCLRKSVNRKGKTVLAKKKPIKKALQRKRLTPKLRPQTPRKAIKGKKLFEKTVSTSESAISSQMSIHDSSSNDINFSQSDKSVQL